MRWIFKISVVWNVFCVATLAWQVYIAGCHAGLSLCPALVWCVGKDRLKRTGNGLSWKLSWKELNRSFFSGYVMSSEPDLDPLGDIHTCNVCQAMFSSKEHLEIHAMWCLKSDPNCPTESPPPSISGNGAKGKFHYWCSRPFNFCFRSFKGCIFHLCDSSGYKVNVKVKIRDLLFTLLRLVWRRKVEPPTLAACAIQKNRKKYLSFRFL